MFKKWQQLTVELRAGNDMLDYFHTIKNAYEEPHRAYHNLNHIAHCFAEYEEVKSKLDITLDVALAIWFHDIVYNPKSTRNEEKSRKAAIAALTGFNVEKDRIKRVGALILTTAHDRPLRGIDAEYLIDIDIAILGAAPEIYQEYEKNIRKEYSWVPGILYRKKRREVLKTFTGRQHVYNTDYFIEKYERQSRENLAWAIDALRK